MFKKSIFNNFTYTVSNDQVISNNESQKGVKALRLIDIHQESFTFNGVEMSI